MNENKQNYGCVICKYAASCEPNPFGICKDFEEEEEKEEEG